MRAVHGKPSSLNSRATIRQSSPKLVESSPQLKELAFQVGGLEEAAGPHSSARRWCDPGFILQA